MNSCLNSSIAVLSRHRCITSSRLSGQRAHTLIPVPLTKDSWPPAGLSTRSSVAFSLPNAQSVNKKCFIIKDYVVDNNIDILALTETWLQPKNVDDHIIGDLTPTGYSFHHIRRQTRGVGVGFDFLNQQFLHINSKHLSLWLCKLGLQWLGTLVWYYLSPSSIVRF